MYFSMTFMEPNLNISTLAKNTWDDWHLIPSERPVINPPSVNTKYIEIPNHNGGLDATELLTGYPTYGTRTGSWEFIVENDHARWIDIYTTICDYLHGKKKRMVWEEDREHYYEGRFSVNKWKSDKHYSTIAIDYTLDPYKIRMNTAASDWLWDPFNFETGIITNGFFTSWSVSDSATYQTMFDSAAYAVSEIAEMIGTKPVVPRLSVSCPDNTGIDMHFVNLELGLDTEYHIVPTGLDTDFSIDIPDFVITNRTMGNRILIEAKGSGTIKAFDFVIGRL